MSDVLGGAGVLSPLVTVLVVGVESSELLEASGVITAGVVSSA